MASGFGSSNRRRRGGFGAGGGGFGGARAGGGGNSAPPQELSPEEQRVGRITSFLGQGRGDPYQAAMDIQHRGPASGPVSMAIGATQMGHRSQVGMIGKGLALEGVENERFAAASERLTGAVDNLPQTFSDRDFDEFFQDEFTLGAETASRNALGDFGAVRSALGLGGVTGAGLAAGLAQQVDLQRLRDTKQRALTAKLDLRQAKMNADAADAMRNIQSEFQLANFNNQSPSLLGLDTLTNATEMALTELGLWLGTDAAAKSRDAQKDAGFLSFIGDAATSLVPGLKLLEDLEL